jgi:CheY-like chemotaxis protein
LNAATLRNRVLVVDDDEALRTSAAAILRSCGYAITEAEDEEAALASLASQPVDVMVLDLRMPKKNGDEVLAALAEPPVVVVVSAYAPEEQLLDRVGSKIFKYLRKPVPPAKLMATVEEALEEAGGGEP